MVLAWVQCQGRNQPPTNHQYNIAIGEGNRACACAPRRKVVEKPQKEVMAEIQAIVRQITASVTFLPLLNDPCALSMPSPRINRLVLRPRAQIA